MEVLPDRCTFYPLPPWRAQGKGGYLCILVLLLKPVGIMDTHRDPHLRQIPDQCPYPHCLTPPGQDPSGEAGKEGTVGKGGCTFGEGRILGKGWSEVEVFHQSHGPHCTNLQEYSKWSLYC
ncbi:hypothetical protein ElyMa_005399000 [Elysia marginata]|uniref:Uncharacterized protein n=1 Tax=Elysia marginata TaxID=1093978 RepID=A0AAV4EHZ1_9GAST|nr:hypothetical protein ElyMa_005399000 [Elysia marginata]